MIVFPAGTFASHRYDAAMQQFLCRLILTIVVFSNAHAAPIWPTPTSTAKPWTRWWWHGSAVDPASLTRQLEQFAHAGIGGVEICPIYGVNGYDDREKKFLSDEWMQALQHTCQEGQRIGIGIDLTTGTGWPFGGPWLKREHTSQSISWKNATTASIENATRRDRLMAVKRAAPGGEGPVVDPFSTVALTQYLQPFDAAWKKHQPNGIRAQFHDSFEYYGANWTPDFLQEFASRRGYDLAPHLPALAGHGDPQVIARIKHDYRMTLSELHIAYMRHWNRWSNEKNSLTRNQGHGAPCNLIDLYAAADIPETEAYGGLPDSHMPMLQMASSAVHLKGTTLVSAESFTWLGDHFQTAHADLKAAADYLWLCGVNHIFFHGIPFSPNDAPWPGWQFYASVNMGPHGGLWHAMPAFNAYITRVQSILQSSSYDADALLYFPVSDLFQSPSGQVMAFTMHNIEEYFGTHPFYQSARQLRQQGVQFDFVSDDFLQKAEVKNGRIVIGKQSWPCLYLSTTQVMPSATMQKLMDLTEAGATIYLEGELPKTVEGFHRYAERERALQQCLSRLSWQEEQGRTMARVGQGCWIKAKTSQEFVASKALPAESWQQIGLHGLRLRSESGMRYFLVNRGDRMIDDFLPLRGNNFIMMNPLNDHQMGQAEKKLTPDGITFRVRLLPGESMILQQKDDADEAPQWSYHQPIGSALTLAQDWQLEFLDGGPTIPSALTMKSLQPWTKESATEYQQFSGTARYRYTLMMPATVEQRYELNLGEVADSAAVRLNGKAIDLLWARPFRLVLDGHLQPGKNVLEIDVTNVAANRIAYLDRTKKPWKIFKQINIVSKAGQPFDASKWPTRPAGLMGPVTLQAVK
jgi:hypothetical protein